MKFVIATRVVGSILAVALLGAVVGDHFHHPEQSQSPAVSQSASHRSTDEPEHGVFVGPPADPRAAVHATATMANSSVPVANGRPADTGSEARQASLPDAMPLLAVLLSAGLFSLARIGRVKFWPVPNSALRRAW
jgi:hypothetical protein